MRQSALCRNKLASIGAYGDLGSPLHMKKQCCDLPVDPTQSANQLARRVANSAAMLKKLCKSEERNRLQRLYDIVKLMPEGVFNDHNLMAQSASRDARTLATCKTFR